MADEPDLLTAAPHDAVMWTPKAIADRDGVSKQSVTIRARKFAENHGLIVERDARGRIVKLNVVQYDQLRSQNAEPSKVKLPTPKAVQKPPAADSFEEARRTQAWLDAERSRLALAEAQGKLIPIDSVRAAISDAGDTIASIIDRLPNVSDDLAPDVIKTGPHGLRVGMTKEANRMRAEIAKALMAAMHPAAKPEDGVQPVQT